MEKFCEVLGNGYLEIVLEGEYKTWAVEIEPEKIRAWPVIKPWLLRRPDATLYPLS